MNTTLSRTEIEELIDEWVLSERDRKLMKRRLIDGICIEPLSEEFAMSPRQVHRIVKKITSKLQERGF